jgi:hypothetical protein
MAKDMCSGQAAVAADDYQSFNFVVNDVSCRSQTSSPFSELLAAGRADNGAALVKDSADIIPANRPYSLAAIYQTLVAFVYGVGFQPPA